ncbi:maleylpyruvate isomerase family mycothiol-dependent enzyme [Agrococcus beijingensis]|uniref:maleylpyruvate isomerase family mycothiol-dependent enzyme n=1 Tax=Agrococcus beijingensis TaxID=3068634 RepID=UPI00274121C7|nr:maleylpyruvate isomerase family mycothiol-dependent enzyme [Agrococcus sp. REN33]
MSVHFGRAAFELVDLVDRVPRERLDRPGLGEWSLRELIGHTSRAISTVVDYLAQPEPAEVTVHSACEYLEVVLRQQGDDEAIELRGRAAAQQLGDDPATAIAELASAAVAAVDAVGLDRLIAVGLPAAGVAMRLEEYLRTRVFELTVHGVDIADAAGLDWTPPSGHLVDALHLAAVNASARERGLEALRYLTGRRPDAGLEGVMRAGR